MLRGYVKVWRKIVDSGLIQLPYTLALFMHLLLNATHKDRKVGTTTGVIELKKGQYISGRIELAAQLKQTEQQIRTSLKRLQDLEIITITSTNKYSIYTIENYSKYQEEQEANNQQTNQQLTNNQPADNQQTTTKQTLKHLNIEKDKAKAPLAMLVSMGIPEPLAKDWLKVRKAKNAAATQTAFDAIKKHAEGNGYTFVQAVQIATENNWSGFKVDWLKNAQSQNGSAAKSRGVSTATDDATLMALAREYKVETYQQTKPSLVAKLNKAMGVM